MAKNPKPAAANVILAQEMAEKQEWHACCMMNGMTGPPIGRTKPQELVVNIKTTFFSAVAALLVSTLAVGSAIAPASVAIAAPIKIAQYA